MDRYEQIKLLGAGQFGEVYLVRQRSDGKLYAAKVISTQFASSAKQEAALLQRMRHPNIVSFVECIDEPSRLTIIMEYASGGDLADHLQAYKASQRSLSESEFMRLFIQIVLAIHHLHNNRILHRDLKPKNILLNELGVLKLSDFGVSKALGSSVDMGKTQVGTPYYIAPEICEDKPYTTKCDIWSLGCVLFEMWSFVPPFTGRSIAAVINQVLNKEAPDLPTIYSSQLGQLIRKMLSKDPEKRPDAREIIASDIVQDYMAKLISVCTFNEAISLESHSTNNKIPNMQIDRHTGPTSQSTTAILSPKEEEAGDLARQQFIENQAAARRNKARVDNKIVVSPLLLAWETDARRDTPKTKGAVKVESVPDVNPYNYYIENRKAAQMNKQRALEEIEHTSLRQDIETSSSTPPPPPANLYREKKSTMNYEEMLEMERRRVRMETKALHDKMRSLKNTDDTSTEMSNE